MDLKRNNLLKVWFSNLATKDSQQYITPTEMKTYAYEFSTALHGTTWDVQLMDYGMDISGYFGIYELSQDLLANVDIDNSINILKEWFPMIVSDLQEIVPEPRVNLNLGQIQENILDPYLTEYHRIFINNLKKDGYEFLMFGISPVNFHNFILDIENLGYDPTCIMDVSASIDDTPISILYAKPNVGQVSIDACLTNLKSESLLDIVCYINNITKLINNHKHKKIRNTLCIPTKVNLNIRNAGKIKKFQHSIESREGLSIEIVSHLNESYLLFFDKELFNAFEELKETYTHYILLNEEHSDTGNIKLAIENILAVIKLRLVAISRITGEFGELNVEE